MPCKLDPPCVQCAFGGNQPLPTGGLVVLMKKEDYGCQKGGGDVVQTVEGVGLLTSSGVRFLTKRGETLVRQKGLSAQFNLHAHEAHA